MKVFPFLCPLNLFPDVAGKVAFIQSKWFLTLLLLLTEIIIE